MLRIARGRIVILEADWWSQIALSFSIYEEPTIAQKENDPGESLHQEYWYILSQVQNKFFPFPSEKKWVYFKPET